MIEVKNISKSLPNGKVLLKEISFKVEKGEFIGVLGPSGAGKTLTIRSIIGLTQPTSGEILIRENDKIKNFTTSNPRQARKLKQKMGVIFQGFNLVKRLTAIENVMLGRLGQINTFRSLFYGFTDDEAKEALDALELVKIAHLAFRKAGSLSGGEMQRVAIARALFQNPLVLMADEPIANLDPTNAKKIMKILKKLSCDIPIVGVFHQPEITMKYCTRIIAIKDGGVFYDGGTDISNELLVDIYGEELNHLEEENKLNQNLSHPQVI